MSSKTEDKRSSARRNNYSLHDQELLAAKNADRQVVIALCRPTYFTNTMGVFTCKIDKVDKYAIRVIDDDETSFWVTKQAILSTEVLV